MGLHLHLHQGFCIVLDIPCGVLNPMLALTHVSP